MEGMLLGIIYVTVILLFIYLMTRRVVVVVHQTPEPSWWPWGITEYNWWPYWVRGGTRGPHMEYRTERHYDRPWGGGGRHANGISGGHRAPSGGHSAHSGRHESSGEHTSSGGYTSSRGRHR